MIAKGVEMKEAIRLRKAGKTYSEILDVVHVSKSTLSLWLRKVELSKSQKQIYSAKKRAAGKRGGAARRLARERDELLIQTISQKEIGTLTKREKWLIGIALYWGEGSKQKPHNVSQGVDFINDDYRVIKFYLEWLDLIGIAQRDLIFHVYIHEASRGRNKEVLEHWSRKLSLNNETAVNVYYKRHATRGFRRKLLSDYFGSMRVRVRSSTQLNRRIMGWTMGIVKNCRIV